MLAGTPGPWLTYCFERKSRRETARRPQSEDASGHGGHDYANPRNEVILTRVMPARVKPAATNPFRFGRIVSGDAFTDRETDILVLERELRGGQYILIEAPRRFGKTSLILEVKRRLEAGGIRVAYLDCMLVPSRARLADPLPAPPSRALQKSRPKGGQRV